MADDYRQRVAEAIAAKFTYPAHRCDRDGENERVENAEPADRIDQMPYVMVTAGDGCRSFYTPTCAELANVVADVRDQDAETLRSDNEDLRKRVAAYENAISWGTDCVAHATLHDERRRQEERAETAEAEVARLRAGESPEPPAPGTMLTPAQWLRRYNDATPEKRLEVIEHVQDSAERAYRCVMADHESLLAELHRVQAVIDDLTQLVRDLANPNACDLDDIGFCRVHAEPPTCPHARARDVLAAQEAGGGRG